MRTKTLLTEALFAKHGEAFAPICLPHTWNAIDGQDGGSDYYRGTCWYAKGLSRKDLPEADRYYLEFEGTAASAVLYVNGEKVYGSGETPDGSKTAPYTSLADAYACIDDEAGGTVVIMGDTKWDGDYSGYGITGTVNITSSYDGDSYITGDDPAYLVLTGDVTLSDSTNIDKMIAGRASTGGNVSITVNMTDDTLAEWQEVFTEHIQ